MFAEDESGSAGHKMRNIGRGGRVRAIGWAGKEAKGRWMDGPAVTERADVPVPNEINRDPPVQPDASPSERDPAASRRASLPADRNLRGQQPIVIDRTVRSSLGLPAPMRPVRAS